jgi:branched-chain amino acid transport system substrate-binding protein
MFCNGILIWVLAAMVLGFGFAPANGAEEIKMLSIDPISGVMKDIGDRYQLGVKFAVEEINAAGGLLGKPVKVFYDDSQLKPDVATRKATRYIAEENVKIVMAGTGTHVGNALGQVAEKNKIIFLNFGCAGDELTGKDFTPYQFRMTLSTSQQSGALAGHFASTSYTRFYILCQDYAFGHDVAESFKKGMNRLKPGWEKVGEDFHPIGSKDLGPYISKVIDSKAEILITGNFGNDLLVLTKQAAGLGLKAKIGSYYLNDPKVLQVLGDSAVGSIVADTYMLTIDTPQNKAFIDRWRKRNLSPENPYPDLTTGRSYQAVMFLAEAIKKAKSVEAEEIIKAWEGMTFDAPIGKVTMRPCDHQMIAPIPVAEILAGPNPYYNFPFVGKPVMIPADKAAVPPAETGNPRCK